MSFMLLNYYFRKIGLRDSVHHLSQFDRCRHVEMVCCVGESQMLWCRIAVMNNDSHETRLSFLLAEDFDTHYCWVLNARFFKILTREMFPVAKNSF